MRLDIYQLRTGAVLFFQLMSRRYEKASTVLTSNKDFEQWDEVLGDDVMAVALIDRCCSYINCCCNPMPQTLIFVVSSTSPGGFLMPIGDIENTMPERDLRRETGVQASIHRAGRSFTRCSLGPPVIREGAMTSRFQCCLRR